MASLLTGLGVLLVSFFLLGLLFFLPTCILAVIICVVVWSILSEAPHDVIVSAVQAFLPSTMLTPPLVLLAHESLDRLLAHGNDIHPDPLRQRRGTPSSPPLPSSLTSHPHTDRHRRLPPRLWLSLHPRVGSYASEDPRTRAGYKLLRACR